MKTKTVPVSFHKVTVEGINLFYREAGDPQSPTVLLLHGFPTSSHMFRHLIPELATQYRVIAPDLPGFGFSDAPDHKVLTTPSTAWQKSWDHSPNKLA
jgi:pimeloyl-ACP methyl ester carboxylesterase